MEETWKDIKNFEGLYQVSNLGRVKSLTRIRSNNNCVYRGRILKSQLNNCGYEMIPLCKESKRFLKSIHRLVAQAFIPNPDNLPEVNHLNGKNDNRAESLEWNSKSDNMHHATKNKLIRKGENVNTAKLTQIQVKEIRNKYKPRHYTMKMLAEEYGVCHATIQKIIYLTNWKSLD